MFRILYREHRCRDCGEPNDRPTCACGYIRPLNDEFFVVPIGRSLSWSSSGPHPRVRLSSFDRYRVRDVLLEASPRHDGDGTGDGSGHGYGDGDGGGWGDGRGGGYGVFDDDAVAAAADVASDPAAADAADAPGDAAPAAYADAARTDDLVEFVIHELRRW